MDIDFLINLLKFSSILIGTISGIIGLFIKVKDETTKKITKQAYIILIIILLSGFISVLLQVFELKKEAINNAKNDRITLKQLELNNQILNNINRTLHPLKDISVDIEISHSLADSLLQPYFQRLDKVAKLVGDSAKIDELQNNYELELIPNELNNGYSYNFEFSGESSFLPTPNSFENDFFAYCVLRAVDIHLSMQKDFDIDNFTRHPGENDFSFMLRLNTVDSRGKDGDIHYQYHLNEKSIFLSGQHYKIDGIHKSGRILSSVDFEKSTLIVFIKSYRWGDEYTKDVEKQIARLDAEFNLDYLRVTIDDVPNFISGQKFKTINIGDDKFFIYTFP